MMQEETERKTVNLAVTTTKVTARALCNGIKTFLANRKRAKAYRMPKEAHGRQSVKKLLKTPQAISKIPVNDENIREFYKLAKKYGVDFAVTKDKSKDPPVYTVFFKAKDTEALQHIADTLLERQMKPKKKRPSLVSQLAKLKEIVSRIPHKHRHRNKEKSL